MSHSTRTLKSGRTVDVYRNAGLRKLCDCSRRTWAKCEHPWHFSFKWDGKHYRFSLDREVGRRMKDKTDARGEADRLRIAIRDGRFRQRVELVPVPATPDAKTFADFADTYLTRGVQASGKKSWYDDKIVLGKLAAFRFEDGSTLGDKALGAITEDDLEAVLADLRTRGRSVSTCNKYIQITKAAFRWAVRKGYLAASPVSPESALKRRKPGQRNRRLEPGEEAALLKAAPLRLHRLIVAALETGCRFGELISLQWRNVESRPARSHDPGRAQQDAHRPHAPDLGSPRRRARNGEARSGRREAPAGEVRLR